ncbi:hypothetical protein GCM10010441_02730 [Kitasatospora paracochleata]
MPCTSLVRAVQSAGLAEAADGEGDPVADPEGDGAGGLLIDWAFLPVPVPVQAARAAVAAAPAARRSTARRSGVGGRVAGGGVVLSAIVVLRFSVRCAVGSGAVSSLTDSRVQGLGRRPGRCGGLRFIGPGVGRTPAVIAETTQR